MSSAFSTREKLIWPVSPARNSSIQHSVCGGQVSQYTSLKRIRNVVSVLVMPGKAPRLAMYLKLPGSLGEENSFSRDMSSIGHWGTGDLEVNVRTVEDWERARSLVDQAYQQS